MPGAERGALEQQLASLQAQEALGVVFPEQEISQIVEKFFPTVEDISLVPPAERARVEDQQALAAEKGQEFISNIIAQGRTPETEALLKTLDPSLSDEDITEIFTGPTDVFAESQVKNLPLVKLSGAGEAELDALFNTKGERSSVEDWIVKNTGRPKDDTLVQKTINDIIKLLTGVAPPPNLAEQAQLSFITGWGNVISGASGTAGWLGFEGVAENLSAIGADLQENRPPNTLGEFNIADLLNPEFYATKVAEAIPFALSLAPLAIGGFYGASGLAVALGVGKIAAWLIGGFGGAALSRPAESALEAGSQYDDAIARGKTPKQAREEANEVFRNNLLLVGADAWEIAIALAPTPKWVPAALIKRGLVRTAVIAGKVVIVGLSEGGEELYQDWVSRHARGEEWKLDPVGKEVFAIGFMLGGGMAIGGDVIANVTEQSKAKMTPEQLAEFGKTVSGFQEEGFNKGESELKALDVVAQTPEGAEVVGEAIETVKQTTPEITPTVEVAPTLAVPEITRVGKLAIPSEEQGIFLQGDKFATPQGEVELSVFSTADKKWVIALPDGTEIKMSIAEIDSLTHPETGIWTKVPEAVEPTVEVPTEVLGRVLPDTFEGKNIFEMTLQELDTASKQVTAEEVNISKEVLGEELGARYDRLQRISNTGSEARAESAESEIDKIEANLTSEQKDRLFGIGEAGASAAELIDLRNALNTVSAESEQEMGESLASTILDLPSHTDFSKMTGAEKEAVAVLRHANTLAQENGFDTTRVTNIAIESSARRFEPADAEFMLRKVRQLLAVKLPAVEAVAEVTPPEALPKPVTVTPPTAPVVEPVVKPPPVEEITPAEIEVRRQLGELQKMSDIWAKKLADREQTKASLAKFVRESLPDNVRGKFVTSVARIKTDAQLHKQLVRVSEVAELNAQKVLKIEIQKVLKQTKAKVKDHILKGKFTPDVQQRLDVLSHNLNLDRDTARVKMTENIAAFDAGTLSYEEMLKANEALNFAGIDGMSAEELSNTLDYIKVLRDVGRSERQAKQATATERIKVIRTDISGVITGGRGLKTGVGAVPRAQLTAKPSWVDTFVNWQYSIDDMADKLSKFDTASDPFQSELSQFVAQVHRATNRQVIGTKDAYNTLKDTIKEVYGVKTNREINNILNGLGEEVNLGVFELTAEYKANHPDAATVTIKMTRDEMLAKYMQMQDLTLTNTFTTGMGWSQEVRDAVEANLTADEKKLADAMFEFYEAYYQSVNVIYQELYNVDMPHNPKYSPIRRDLEGDITEHILSFQDASQYASVLNGSLKARQRNIRPLRFNGATSILSSHITQMEHFKAWAITMRDMRRVFASTEIRQGIEQYHGRGILRLIDTFLNQMARGGIETAATNRVADFLRRSFTKSILAIKPVIALKQIPSLFAYISEMNVTDFFIGVADFWTSPIKNFRFLYNNSEMFRARMSVGFERDIRAAMEKHGKKAISGQGKITDWFLLQIRLGDTFAVTQGMWAKYKAGLKQGLSQEEAIASAEDTTGRTQPSFGIDTLSALQNGGSFLKILTMFQNQPNKYFRITGDNMRNFKYGRGSRAKAASTILLTWVLLPMMFQFVADAFQWKPERQARAGILGPLNFILIGGQLVQSMWGWLTDQPFDYQVSPVAQTGRDLQMIFMKARKLLAQGQDPYKDISGDDVAAVIEYLAKAIGQLTGLPTPYFVQVEKGIRQKLAAGEDIDIKDFLFSQWALVPPAKNAEQKVDDINLKLGEIREGEEDAPLSERELKIYTTVDWLRDIGNVFSNVLPQDVLDNPASSKESKAWAEYENARSQADILPNIPLFKINTEDNADTIINYYEQWKARERIESLAELIEFDKLYPRAYLGNVTRQQYNLLVKYLESENKETFLEDHPELRINARDEWLKEHPVENALLALGGQADILSVKAYDELNKLVEELDIPEDAIPGLTLPPEGSVETHFDYLESGAEFGWNSWETQLVLAKDPAYSDWRGLQPIDTPIEALELKVKNRELSDEYDSFNDKDSANYIEDADAREEKRKQYLIDNPEFNDDRRRIQAIENSATGETIEEWVDRGNTADEFGAGSSEAKVWLLDHPDTFTWALEQKLLTDDGSDWNEPVLRINTEWSKWDDLYDVAADVVIDGVEFTAKQVRDAILQVSPEYAIARMKRNAYGEGVPAQLIDQWVEYYSLPLGKARTDYLISHPAYYTVVWLGLQENKPVKGAQTVAITQEGIIEPTGEGESQRPIAEAIVSDFPEAINRLLVEDREVINEAVSIIEDALNGIFPDDARRLELIDTLRLLVDKYVEQFGGGADNLAADILARARDFLEDIPAMSQDTELLMVTKEREE